MFVIGIDVHVRNSYMHICRADGTTFKKGRVANTLMDFAEFLAPLEGQQVKAVMESTTNSRPVCVLLQEYARQAGVDLDLRVLHARKLRLIAASESKCDKIDGSVLARLANSNLNLACSYMPDEDVFQLRELTRTREDFVDSRTVLKCQVHAILHRRGLLLPEGMDLFSKIGRSWSAEHVTDVVGKAARESLYRLIDAFDVQIKEFDARLAQAAASPRWKADHDLLRTMPGVGPVTAMTVLGELGDIGRFKSRAALSNYAGLVPSNRSSNEKVWQGSIKKQGPRHLRRVLVEAAWSGVRNSVTYKGIYEGIVERKGKKLVAITAVARRMLEDMYTLLKTRSAFKDKSSMSDAG